MVVFPCLVGLSIDAFQRNVFISFERDGQYGRKHDVSNRLILVVQDMEWVKLYPLGTVNNNVVRPDYREYSGSVLSSLPAPVNVLAVYSDVVFSDA